MAYAGGILCARPPSGKAKRHFQPLFAKSRSRAPSGKFYTWDSAVVLVMVTCASPDLALRMLISKKKGFNLPPPSGEICKKPFSSPLLNNFLRTHLEEMDRIYIMILSKTSLNSRLWYDDRYYRQSEQCANWYQLIIAAIRNVGWVKPA